MALLDHRPAFDSRHSSLLLSDGRKASLSLWVPIPSCSGFPAFAGMTGGLVTLAHHAADALFGAAG